MQKASKIWSKITDVFFYIILAALIAVLVMFLFGVKPYITMSGSMEPAIHTGSVCFVNTKAEFQDMRIGDIIAYRSPSGGLVTHRIIGMEATGFETKGDNNDVSDGVSTTPANFHGETLFSVPYVGYGIKSLQNPAVIAIVVILMIGKFALGFVESKEENKENAENAESEEPAEQANT